MGHHEYKEWVRKLIKVNQKLIFFLQICQLIDEIKKYTEEYEELANKRILSETEKLLFGSTDRAAEFNKTISDICKRMKVLANLMKSKTKTLHEYEDACKNCKI